MREDLWAPAAVRGGDKETSLSTEPNQGARWDEPRPLAAARQAPLQGAPGEELAEVWSPVRLQQVGPLTAALRRPVLLALPVILLLVPSVALAMAKAPTWKAESRLLIGRLDVEANSTPGFVEASNSLAATYARLLNSSPVTKLVAARLKQSDASVAGHLSASPIPESPIIRIEASAGTEREAVALTNAANLALVDYVHEVSANGSRATGLLDDYNKALADLAQANRDRDARQADFDAARAGAAPRPAVTAAPAKGAKPVPAAPVTAPPNAAERVAAAQAALSAAQAKVDGLKLQSENYAQLYQSSQRGLADTGVTVVQEGRSMGNDHKRKLELAGAAGILGGLVVGLALVTLVENRPAIRALRRRTPAPAG
jgi:hypothetical protein